MPPVEWHPVTQTALGVARVRAAESSRPDRLFDDPCAEIFLRAAGDSTSSPGSATQRDVGLGGWIVARTRFLDELVVYACGEEACAQVVILGAGLDSRAFRLPLPAGTVFFELDTEPLIAFKKDSIASGGLRPVCDHRLVGVDLAERWLPALTGSGFQPGVPTVWLAEGLLVYLQAEVRDRLLRTAAELGPPGSRLGATIPATGRRRQLQAQGRGELWLSDGPENPAAWLAGLGWQADLFDSRERLAVYGRPPPDWDGQGWHPGRPALVSARRR